MSRVKNLRAPARLGLVGVAALLLGVLLSLAFGAVAMPSYLAAWLFAAAIPFGALPVVMAADLLGASGALVARLRGQLLLAPVAALLAVPVLLRMGLLFGRGVALASPFARVVLRPPGSVVLVLVALLAWTGLALLFARAPAPGARRGLAGFGLLLHVTLGSVLAAELAMAVEPNWSVGDFGLLLLVSQSLVAIGASLVAAPEAERGGAAVVPLLLGLVWAWMFLEFTQFLTVWAANLPAEVVWYLHRGGPFGVGAAWLGAIAGFTAPLVLLGFMGDAALLPVAWLLLVVQAVGVFWLITPAFRDGFRPGGMDALELLGLLCLLLAARAWLGGEPRRFRGARHG